MDNERTGTAYLIKTPHGYVVEIDGQLHTLTRLFNVDTVELLEGNDAAECIDGHLSTYRLVGV
jgi:hypothetical protein